MMKKWVSAAVVGIALLGGGASYAAEIELKLAHTWPKGFPLFGTSVDDYAALVSELSDGRIASA